MSRAKQGLSGEFNDPMFKAAIQGQVSLLLAGAACGAYRLSYRLMTDVLQIRARHNVNELLPNLSYWGVGLAEVAPAVSSMSVGTVLAAGSLSYFVSAIQNIREPLKSARLVNEPKNQPAWATPLEGSFDATESIQQLPH